jgi:hypothetical protein
MKTSNGPVIFNVYELSKNFEERIDENYKKSLEKDKRIIKIVKMVDELHYYLFQFSGNYFPTSES